MGWRFWHRKSVTLEEVVDTKVSPEEDGTHSPLADLGPTGHDPPKLDDFRFETDVSRSTRAQSGGPAPERPDTAAVVRRTATRRFPTSPTAIRPGDRACWPLLVPSIREQAQLYRLAAAERAQSNVDESSKLWHAYLELCPDDGAAWFEAGQIDLARRALESARTAFEQAIRHDSDNPRAIAALGFLAGATGSWSVAVEHYAKAVTLAPHDVELLTGLATAQTAAGLPEAAETTYNQISLIRDD